MKKTFLITMLACLLGVTVCFADSDLPNLVGTWTVEAEGGVMAKGGSPGAKTHHSGEFSTLSAEVVVTKQQGRVFHGVFKSPKAAENFIGVVGADNKSLYMADEDGFMNGKLSGKNKVEIVYRHVTANDTVVGVGTWKRKK